MRRICIYVVYDRKDVVDGYIEYILRELRSCVDYLLVVRNTDSDDIAMSENLPCDTVYCRANKGFDAGAFKDALCDYVGWDRLGGFDELVLANDSFFGPFCPMQDIFEMMEKKKVDFWGLQKHGESTNVQKGIFHEYIQTYFLVVRKEMLQSREFRTYWEEMPYYHSFTDVVRNHEEKFTHYFSSLGYRYDTLADTEANDSFNTDNNFLQYMTISDELIKKRNFPFLKRQQMAYNTLDLQTQEHLRRSLQYIDNCTDYNVDLIWENVIRTMNMGDLQRSLCLRYIIKGSEELMSDVSVKAIIMIFAEYLSAVESVEEYLDQLGSHYDVLIFSGNEEVREAYRKFQHRTLARNENWKDELLACMEEQELVCLIHDTDLLSDVMPSYIGKSFFYNRWENLVRNAAHISEIRNIFGREKHLGILFPPKPNFGQFFGEYVKSCFVGGCDLWIRTKILREVLEREFLEENLFQDLWIDIAKSMGYYSGIVESSDYAAMNEVNKDYYLSEIGKQIRNYYGEFRDFKGLLFYLTEGAVYRFLYTMKRVYVYGIGYMAEQYKSLFKNIEAYIVSDGQNKPEWHEGKKVFYLSEIVASDDVGIIVCMDKQHQGEVVGLLEEKRIRDYLCIP